MFGKMRKTQELLQDLWGGIWLTNLKEHAFMVINTEELIWMIEQVKDESGSFVCEFDLLDKNDLEL